MRKKILAILSLITLLSCPPTALADGMVVSPPFHQVYETGQKAVIWFENGEETLILSTAFKGDAKDFGWIIPLPSKPEVEKGSDEIFTSLQDLTQPKAVYEDRGIVGSGMLSLNVPEKAPVTVVETKKVDIYDISVVTSTESEALAQWFKKNDYPYPVSQAYILDEYIQNGWFFVAAKIDTAKLGQIVENQLKDGHATPLMIKFKTDKIIYPMKISSVTGDFYQSEIVYQENFNFSIGDWVTKEGEPKLDSEIAYEGRSSLQINAKPITGIIETSRILTGLTKGKTYTFSAYLRTDPKNTGFAYLKVSQSDLEAQSDISKLTSQWQRLTLTFTAKTESHRLSLVANGFSQDQTYNIDAVQVEAGSGATSFEEGNLGGGFNSNSITVTRKIPTPKLYTGNVDVLLYVFDAKKKVEIPGFSVSYAGWLRPTQIEKLAVDSQGDPLLTAKNKMYLTKLSRNIVPSQMTDDLYPRYADDNKTVGQGSSITIAPNKLLLVFAIPFLAEIWFIYWLFSRRKNSAKQNRREVK